MAPPLASAASPPPTQARSYRTEARGKVLCARNERTRAESVIDRVVERVGLLSFPDRRARRLIDDRQGQGSSRSHRSYAYGGIAFGSAAAKRKYSYKRVTGKCSSAKARHRKRNAPRFAARLIFHQVVIIVSTATTSPD